VCHPTYKDESGNWLSPEEVMLNDNNEYVEKKNQLKKVIIGPSESMSKSKKNTIDPQNIINEYGADAVRHFIISDSPPEKDVQWSINGINSSYKFIQKFWTLHENILEILRHNEDQFDEEIEVFTNQILHKINQALDSFRYNVIIANYHEIYSFLKKKVESHKNYKNLRTNYIKLITVMMPVVPHITNECLSSLEYKELISWPKIDEKYLVETKVEIVIQVNGKKRNALKVQKDMSEDEVKNIINQEKLIEKYLINYEIIKTIFVKNKIINFILKT